MADISNSKLLLQNTGILHTKDACVVIVKTEWNATIVDELEKGCREELQKNGVNKIITIDVPGAIEIPFAINNFQAPKKETRKHKKFPDAFIAIGCVIKGETPHFDYVCKSITDGVLALNLRLPVPVIFGILTVNTEAQAKERAGGKYGHKGKEAAITAIKMINLNHSFKKQKN